MPAFRDVTFKTYAHLIQKQTVSHFLGCGFLSARTSCPKTVSHFLGCGFFKRTHILSKNRFTLFGMWLFKCTHILSKNRFTLFGMSLFKVHAHLVQKPLHTFWDVRVSPLNSLSRPDHPARQYGQPIRHLFAPAPRLPAFPS